MDLNRRKRGCFTDIHGGNGDIGANPIHRGYLNIDPADVALVSPQTPLIPLYNPLLSGGYSKPYPWIAPLLASLQWVFCVFTCNHPPQQTLHPVAPRHPSSQAFREEGPFKRYIAIQTKNTYISGKWSLLSKGLRGGKSRRLRVESLLRRMIASEDAKNPLQIRK